MNQSSNSVAGAFAQKFGFWAKRNANNWQLWAVLIIILSGSAGFMATTALFKLPKTPQCARIFWPIASASLRFYCADLEAEKGTAEGLLTAIKLVEALPANHPLRHQVDLQAEEWAEQILVLAEEEFQAGQFSQAMESAQKIPQKSKAYALVAEKTEKWRSIWQEAKDVFADIEEQLRESNWNLAFRYAVKLLTLDNQYWATTKYDEAVDNIQVAREESRRMDDAFVVMERGGVDNWLKAVEVAEKIAPESYAYRQAQKLITTVKEKITTHIIELLDKRDWNAIANVTSRIPNSLDLTKELISWRTIASAGLDADLGTVEGLKAAMVSLEQLEPSDPFYSDAQTLISRWKMEIEDVTHLAQGRDLAREGNIEGLQAAITEVRQIPQGNPRYSEAVQESRDWNRQIQILEDQPILDQARALAVGGNINDLQKAIAQANLIGANRALHQEAKENIYTWQRKIERQEDQPILDQAIALGNIQDYPTALKTIGQIAQGRVLYPEAQTHAKRWRREIQAQQDLAQAYQLAKANTPEALLNAMDIVRRIPNSTDARSQAAAAVNRWSYQVLNTARQKGDLGQYREAIALARRIPSESDAHSSAANQIDLWKRLITPPPVASEPLQPFPAAVPTPSQPPEATQTRYDESEATAPAP